MKQLLNKKFKEGRLKNIVMHTLFFIIFNSKFKAFGTLN